MEHCTPSSGRRHILHDPVGHELIQDVRQAIPGPLVRHRLLNSAALPSCLGLHSFWGRLGRCLHRVV